jgi:hypothetical protein
MNKKGVHSRQQFPLVSKELLEKEASQNPISGVTPIQVFGLLAIAAVVIGLILFGRKIQKERMPTK